MNDPRYKTARWQKLRAYILRSNPLCRYCGAVANTVDHVVPVAGGGDFWCMDNLAPACAACNYSKADTPAEEFRSCKPDAMGYGGFWDEKS